MGHDHLLAFAHEARVRLLATGGFTELDIDGVGIAVVDVAAVYLGEVKYGMTLTVEVAVMAIRTRSCELYYRIADRDSGRELARVKTGIVFFDYGAGKVVRAPARFREAFGGAP